MAYYPQFLGMPSPCSKHETAEDLEVLPHAANDQLDFFEAHPERSGHKTPCIQHRGDLCFHVCYGGCKPRIISLEFLKPSKTEYYRTIPYIAIFSLCAPRACKLNVVSDCKSSLRVVVSICCTLSGFCIGAALLFHVTIALMV